MVKLESGQDDAARNDFWEALGGTARDDALIGAAAQGELTPEVEAVRPSPPLPCLPVCPVTLACAGVGGA